MLRFCTHFRLRNLVAAAGLLFLLGSCSSPSDEGDDGCTDLGVSKDLVRVMYWGEVTPGEYRPNQGFPTSFVRMPLWYRDDAILVYTAAFFGGPMVRGIFEVKINPQTYSLVGVEPAHFPYPILTFDYLASSEQLLLAYTTSAGIFEVALARVQGADIVSDSVIVDASRVPWSAQADGSGRIVYYSAGASPGFFEAGTDSLLLSLILTPTDALGFDCTADTLYFGQTIGAYSAARSAVLHKDLSTDNPPVVFADLEGEFVSVRADAKGRVLACTYFWGDTDTPPGSRVYQVDVTSGTTHLLDTRTHASGCRFVISDFASWSPDGSAFAFSASSFSGEQDLWPRSLWVHKRPR